MGWKKVALSLVWGIVACGVLGLVALYFTDPSRDVWFAAVTALAVMCEIAFWTTAAILGVTVMQSRKKIFRFLTSPFRRGS
ncbi:MAG: hypothetical protein ABL957_06840 [Parvularculaceae bacterium]